MATVAERLESAQAAWENIITGKAVSAVVDQNGERVEYNRVNVAELRKYIVYLEGLSSLRPTPSGPLRPLF